MAKTDKAEKAAIAGKVSEYDSATCPNCKSKPFNLRDFRKTVDDHGLKEECYPAEEKEDGSIKREPKLGLFNKRRHERHIHHPRCPRYVSSAQV